MLLYIVAALFIIFVWMSNKSESTEALENTEVVAPAAPETPVVSVDSKLITPEPKPLGSYDDMYAEISLDSKTETSEITPQMPNSNELLPSNEDSEFLKENPVAKLLKEQNFLQAGYHFGINTVVQSNKIPYLDIRSVPPIPKMDVGPFNNSSYEQPMGSNRRFLEIGAL